MRERILTEIKRLAAENGGKTPGKNFFHQETGIAESDWYGKLWLRWNDVVTEAGLKPNEKQEKLSGDLVLDMYAEVCRHYGKPPSSAELRLYAREHPNFISHNTFAKHFGSKSGVIGALRARSIERGERDLVAILPKEEAFEVSSNSSGSSNVAEGYTFFNPVTTSRLAAATSWKSE